MENRIKDANDLLINLSEAEIGPDDQKTLIREKLDSTTPIVCWAAEWAGDQSGAAADKAIGRAVEIAAELDPLMAAKYRSTIAGSLHLKLRDYEKMLKAASGAKKPDGEPPEVVYILGGWIPLREDNDDPSRGYLLDYLYDQEEDRARFAVRDPEGAVSTADYVDIEGIRYTPKIPNSLIRSGGVLFPSEMGQLKQTRELVGIVEAFINKYYLIDDRFFGRLASYYVLLSWVHDCFNAIPYLRALGDWGSGKSQLMVRIGHLCYRMMATGGAGTAASLFRALNEYRGTAFMDEMDLTDGGDMANDLIKILNLGAMQGNPVWRLSEVVGPDGIRNYEVQAYNVFGPKLIAMRRDFKDQAVSSRCLTISLMGKEPIELKKRGIPLHLDEEFYKRALAVRNYLIAWRMKKWKPEIEVGEDLMDITVPARLNQVTMPLKAIAEDDPELMSDITLFVRSLNEELMLERSMGLDARILEALIEIKINPDFTEYLMDGSFNGHGEVTYTLTKYVAKVANEIMDRMNIADPDIGGDDQDDKPKRKQRGTTAQTAGRIARKKLQLASHRTGQGYAIIYNDDRMEVLKHKYGLLNYESMGAKNEHKPEQASLL